MCAAATNSYDSVCSVCLFVCLSFLAASPISETTAGEAIYVAITFDNDVGYHVSFVRFRCDDLQTDGKHSEPPFHRNLLITPADDTKGNIYLIRIASDVVELFCNGRARSRRPGSSDVSPLCHLIPSVFLYALLCKLFCLNLLLRPPSEYMCIQKPSRQRSKIYRSIFCIVFMNKI